MRGRKRYYRWRCHTLIYKRPCSLIIPRLCGTSHPPPSLTRTISLSLTTSVYCVISSAACCFGSYMCDTYTKQWKCEISKRQQPKHIFRYKIMIKINERENHKGFHKLNKVFGSVHYIVKLNFQYQWNNILAATQTVNRARSCRSLRQLLSALCGYPSPCVLFYTRSFII